MTRLEAEVSWGIYSLIIDHKTLITMYKLFFFIKLISHSNANHMNLLQVKYSESSFCLSYSLPLMMFKK
jgi:hypothetical protein